MTGRGAGDWGGGRVLHAARFVARENRFVVRARLDTGRRRDGEEVRAHLPNTARLHDLLVADAPLILVHNEDEGRRTRWTVTRVWDETWVALEATAASGFVADHLEGGGSLPGWPSITTVRREVVHGRHRFDLEVDLADGEVGVVEVKSLSRVRDGVAPLSYTPSTRGVAHLGALAERAARGLRTAAVFVVQRCDAEILDLEAPADADWAAAVRRARAVGLQVVAFACEVDERHVRLGEPLLVTPERPA